MPRPRNSQTRAWLEQLFSRHHITATIVAELDNPETIKQAVISGMGIAIMPEFVIQREQKLGLIRALPVQDITLQRALRLIWNKQEPFAPVTRAFLTLLSDQFPQLLSLPQYQPIVSPRLTRLQDLGGTCAQTFNAMVND